MRGMPSLASVKRADRCDSSTSRMISSFSDAEYLIRVRPHRPARFFEQAQFQRLFRHDLLLIAGSTAQILHLVSVCSECSIASQPLLACLHEVLGPLVVDALGNALTVAQLSDAVFPTQPAQDDPDLLF